MIISENLVLLFHIPIIYLKNYILSIFNESLFNQFYTPFYIVNYSLVFLISIQFYILAPTKCFLREESILIPTKQIYLLLVSYFKIFLLYISHLFYICHSYLKSIFSSCFYIIFFYCPISIQIYLVFFFSILNFILLFHQISTIPILHSNFVNFLMSVQISILIFCFTLSIVQ